MNPADYSKFAVHRLSLFIVVGDINAFNCENFCLINFKNLQIFTKFVA